MNSFLSLLLVLLPIAVALGWVFFNIRSAAVKQAQDFLKED